MPTSRAVLGITVVYDDGTEKEINLPGVIKQFTNHDAGNKKGRQEWDVVEITLTGDRRDCIYAPTDG